MKKIPLTNGQFATVDDEDFKELNQFTWQAQWDADTRSFYAVRGVRLPNGKHVKELMHRRILGLEYGDKRQIDHIAHQTLDNRRANIRIVTPSQNQHNYRCKKGYTWNKSHRKYQAQIGVNGRRIFLGYFDGPQEARAAYLKAKAIYHPSAPIALLTRYF